jgi:hypothetical protein
MSTYTGKFIHTCSAQISSSTTFQASKSSYAHYPCSHIINSTCSLLRLPSMSWLWMRPPRLALKIISLSSTTSKSLSSGLSSLEMINSVSTVSLSSIIVPCTNITPVPPFGGDGDIQSIFEVPHLQETRLFLDTQCMCPASFQMIHVNSPSDRMPPQIGDQISTAVYDGKLKSNPLHKVTSATMACHFVDVDKGLGIKPPTGGTSLIVRFCLHALLCH